MFLVSDIVAPVLSGLNERVLPPTPQQPHTRLTSHPLEDGETEVGGTGSHTLKASLQDQKTGLRTGLSTRDPTHPRQGGKEALPPHEAQEGRCESTSQFISATH